MGNLSFYAFIELFDYAISAIYVPNYKEAAISSVNSIDSL